jgi:hypothetical protein
VSEQQRNYFEVPENWAEMTEDEQNAFVEAALMRIFNEES